MEKLLIKSGKGKKGVIEVEQTIGMVTAESGSVFEGLPFDGLLGLGMPSLAVAHHVPPFDTLMN